MDECGFLLQLTAEVYGLNIGLVYWVRPCLIQFLRVSDGDNDFFLMVIVFYIKFVSSIRRWWRFELTTLTLLVFLFSIILQDHLLKYMNYKLSDIIIIYIYESRTCWNLLLDNYRIGCRMENPQIHCWKVTFGKIMGKPEVIILIK